MVEQKPLLRLVEEFLAEQEWGWEPIEGENALRFSFRGDNGRWFCFVTARDEQNQLLFYSVLDVNVAEEKRNAMAEFLTRANYGLVLGNFEMDYSDGEIRFKTSIDGGEGRLPSEAVKPLVFANLVVMDRYLPGIMAVLYSDTTPEEALERVEGKGADG